MSSFELVEVPLSDRKLVERFIRVPWYIHREHHPSPRWVPPLLMDRRDYLNPDKNPFSSTCRRRSGSRARTGATSPGSRRCATKTS
ncbi:hypothetical protein [Nannocystis pusilla]|uniref:hypothetical protein n=1 Tax=Nannocystis pusilla TaxID=889268 RepID=UPI003B77BB07